MAELREQIAAINPGDMVTALFDTPWEGEHRRTGKVTLNDGWLFLGGGALVTHLGTPVAGLIAIESLEPAKPQEREARG